MKFLVVLRLKGILSHFPYRLSSQVLKNSAILRLSRTSASKNHLMTFTSWQSEKARKLTRTFVIAVIFCLPELFCFLVSFLDCKLPQKGRLTHFHLLSLA